MPCTPHIFLLFLFIIPIFLYGVGWAVTHVPSSSCSSIDEIVVSYVSGVLEEVALDQEEVDAAGMKDVMAAYVPEFETLSEEAVTAWVVGMVHAINEQRDKGGTLAFVLDIDEVVVEVN